MTTGSYILLVHHGAGRHLPRRQHRLQVLLLQQDHRLVLHVVVRLPALPASAIDGDRDRLGKGAGTGALRWDSRCSRRRHDRGSDALCVWREGGWEVRPGVGLVGELLLVLMVVAMVVVNTMVVTVAVQGHRREGGRRVRRRVEVVAVDRTVQYFVSVVPGRLVARVVAVR